MEGILEDIMCSTHDDEPRFRKILKKLIKKGEVPEFDDFAKEDTKKQKDRKRKVSQNYCDFPVFMVLSYELATLPHWWRLTTFVQLCKCNITA